HPCGGTVLHQDQGASEFHSRSQFLPTVNRCGAVFSPPVDPGPCHGTGFFSATTVLRRRGGAQPRSVAVMEAAIDDLNGPPGVDIPVMPLVDLFKTSSKLGPGLHTEFIGLSLIANIQLGLEEKLFLFESLTLCVSQNLPFQWDKTAF